MKDERTCTMRREVGSPSLVNDDLLRKVNRRRPHSMRRVYKHLCPATISAFNKGGEHVEK